MKRSNQASRAISQSYTLNGVTPKRKLRRKPKRLSPACARPIITTVKGRRKRKTHAGASTIDQFCEAAFLTENDGGVTQRIWHERVHKGEGANGKIASERQFERLKDALREYGVPHTLTTVAERGPILATYAQEQPNNTVIVVEVSHLAITEAKYGQKRKQCARSTCKAPWKPARYPFFHRNASRPDGLDAYCVDCRCATRRAVYANGGKVRDRQYARSPAGIIARGRYASTPYGRAAIAKAVRRNMTSTTIRIRRRASKLLMHAIRSGAITRPTACTSCGEGAYGVVAMWKDYTRPLEAIFLCRPCHAAERAKGGASSASEDKPT